MSITNTANSVQILSDSATRTVVKCIYFTSDATEETNVLKVNVETLAYRTFTTVLQARVPVRAGQTITGATSNATAIVSEWNASTNTIVFTNFSGNTAFAQNEVLTFTYGNSTIAAANTVASASAFGTPTRILDITSVWYSVDTDMTVQLGFGGDNGSPYVAPAMFLTGSGYFGKNALPAQVLNDATSPTGNFYISSAVQGSSKGGYTVIVEFRKRQGFAPDASTNY